MITFRNLYNLWLEKFLLDSDDKHIDIKNLIIFLNNLLKDKQNLKKFSENELRLLQIEIEKQIFQLKEIQNSYNLISVSNNSEIIKIYNNFNLHFYKFYKESKLYKKFNSVYKLNDNFFIGLFFYELSVSIQESNFYLNTLISKLTVALSNNYLKNLKINDETDIMIEHSWLVDISHALINTAEIIKIIEFNEVNEFKSNKKNIKLHKKWNFTNDIIKNHIKMISSLLNIQLPMIVQPRHWKRSKENCYFFGGFLLSEIYKDISFNLTSNIAKHHTLMNINDDFIDAMNYLQDQGFLINSNYVNYLLDSDITFIEKEFTYEVTSESTGTSIEVFVNLQDYVENKTLKSIEEETYCFKIFFTFFVIQILDGLTLYFVYFIDFRSRIYPYGYPLTFYSAKIFRKCFISKTISNEYLYNNNYFMSNLCKFDKFTQISYDCLKNDNLQHHFLIGMDACASAFQIQGALLKDYKMLKLTNLLNKTDILDIENDIYNYIMLEFKNYVIGNNLINFSEYNFNLYEIEPNNKYNKFVLSKTISNLEDIFLIMCEDRKFFKTIVMPLSYNEGSRSRIQKFMNYFLKKLNQKKHNKLYKFVEKLESIFMDFFNLEFPNFNVLKLLFNFLCKQNSFGFIIKNNYFELKQFYPKTKKVHYFRRRYKKKPLYYTFNVYDFFNLDKTKQRYSSYVNFIHSLDSAIMINLINKFKKEKLNIFPIHDCFYVNTNNIDKVINLYNIAFIEEIILKNPLKILFEVNKLDYNNKTIKKHLKKLGFFDKWSQDDLEFIKHSKFSLKP